VYHIQIVQDEVNSIEVGHGLSLNYINVECEGKCLQVA
jgi:hypothetical protein